MIPQLQYGVELKTSLEFSFKGTPHPVLSHKVIRMIEIAAVCLQCARQAHQPIQLTRNILPIDLLQAMILVQIGKYL